MNESINMYKMMLNDPELNKGQLVKVLRYIETDLNNIEDATIALNTLKANAKQRMEKA